MTHVKPMVTIDRMTKQKSLFEKFRDAQPEAPLAAAESQKGGASESDPPRSLAGVTDDKNALASKLERVTEKAIDKADEILDLPLPNPDSESFGAVLRAQNAAANTVLNTQVKVDEHSLRRQTIDKLPELVRIIREEELKLAALRASETYEGTQPPTPKLIGGEPDG
jgi:hypothetical protein